MKFLPLAALVAAFSLPLILSDSTAATAATPTEDTVRIGLNYPETGPYSVQGLDQIRAAQIAIDEINADGGVLGQTIELVTRDTRSNADIATANAKELIDNEDCSMLFGGSSSAVAIATGKVCQEKSVPFFGTLTYSTATTGKEGNRFTFRETYNAWAGAKVLADYMSANFADKKYVYITADYTWGHTTESSFRTFTNTEDEEQHKRMLTPFPGATDDDFKRAISFAKLAKPDVLVLVLFGKEYWSQVLNFEPMIEYGTISPEDPDLFYMTDSVDEAYEYITSWLEVNVLAKETGDEEPGPDDHGQGDGEAPDDDSLDVQLVDPHLRLRSLASLSRTPSGCRREMGRREGSARSGQLTPMAERLAPAFFALRVRGWSAPPIGSDSSTSMTKLPPRSFAR